MNDEDQGRQVLCNIARSAFEVVNRLLSRDQLLARALRSSETSSRQIYREECLTVEMAATLLQKFPNHVEITLFTPPEETRTGADWYWRFEKGDRAIHAHVQAKRVQRTAFGQDDAIGHVDIDIPQLDQLLDATIKAGDSLPGLQAWVATYARFDAAPPCGQQDLRCCPIHRHEAACAEHQPSLWIAKAQEIRDTLNGARRASVRTLIEHSVRLDCMLPCIVERDPNYGPASKGFVIQNGLKTYQDCVAAIEGDTQLRKEFEGALRIML